MKIKLVIVDDHDILREGIRARLQDHEKFEILAEGRNGHEAVDLYQRHKPDILLTDISMPEMNGLDAAIKILADDPTAKVIRLRRSRIRHQGGEHWGQGFHFERCLKTRNGQRNLPYFTRWSIFRPRRHNQTLPNTTGGRFRINQTRTRCSFPYRQRRFKQRNRKRAKSLGAHNRKPSLINSRQNRWGKCHRLSQNRQRSKFVEVST